jgi:hypothetical protein
MTETPTTPATPMPTPTTLYRNPVPPTVSASTPQNNRLMELRLLHHYTTLTCKTLSHVSPMTETIWRETVPNLAFSGNNFLTDAILAISALHLRSHQPKDQALVRASHGYMASTLSEYGHSLSRGITEANAEALFLTASLIAFGSTASRIFARDDSGDLKDRSDGYALPLSIFQSFQGVKTVVATSWQWLRNSSIVIPIIASQPALDLNLNSQASTFFGSLMDGLDEEIETLDGSSSAETQALTRQAYQHAVAVLNWAHRIPRTGAPMVFLATVSKRYVDLVQARRPRALAVLACFFALLKTFDNVWWLKGVARREIMGIVALFDPDDEEWWPRLQWPVRIALFDGDVIPPDVWGADLNAEAIPMDQAGQEGQTTGSFISHIELLSQMFSAMQSMPAGFSANPVAQQEAAYSNAEDLMSAKEMLQNGLFDPQFDLD